MERSEQGVAATVPCDLSVIIATYNEGPYLEDSVAQVRAVLEQTRLAYELIVIDDASGNDTPATVRRCAAEHGDVLQAVFHDTNQGRGGTVSDGIRRARGQYVGFLDIDLEVHARYIPAMVQALQDGHDVATAYRVYRADLRHLHRHLLSVGYRMLSRRLLHHSLADTETGYKFFHRERILPILDQCQDRGWFWDTEIMVRALRAGLRIVEIPCVFTYRFEKSSTVNVVRDVTDYIVKLWRFRRNTPAP